MSQKEMTLSNQRESLFLRIKKESILEVTLCDNLVKEPD
jgi:hypothetical protein